MLQRKMVTKSEKETVQLAEKLASFLRPGDVITLEGDLGAGKTTFTKGIAKGLGITRTISSPTFTIIKEYDEGTYPLYHIDAYRLEFSEEDIGFDDYFHGDGIAVVEWAQFIADYIPENRFMIEISYLDSESREIIFETSGKRFEAVMDELFR